MHSTADRLPPSQVAADTFVLHDHLGGEPGYPIIHVNTLLIRGKEPIVVDTGTPLGRAQYLSDLFELVDPPDVRWVFLSHDDVDHAGNVEAVMDACPNATLLTTWLATQRLAAIGFSVPPARWRWVDDGDVVDAGDRALVVQRPPLYDSPATRGLLDASTGVFWAADCFATPVDVPRANVADLDAEAWRQGFIEFQQWNSPWFEAVDVGWWQRMVSRFESRKLSAIVSSHGPAITGAHIATAIDMLRELPALPTAPQPGQRLLDTMLALMLGRAV